MVAKKKIAVEKPEKPLRPSQCGPFMRKALAENFPEVLEGFLEEAAKGSCQHVKLATELLQTEEKKRVRPRKGAAQRLLEELEGR